MGDGLKVTQKCLALLQRDVTVEFGAPQTILEFRERIPGKNRLSGPDHLPRQLRGVARLRQQAADPDIGVDDNAGS